MPDDQDLEFLKAENTRLRDAIEKHRAQRADDRCWLDDFELYAALGDGVMADYRVGDKIAMRKNCDRFIEQRCQAEGPWISYVELEKRLAAVTQLLVPEQRPDPIEWR